MATHRPHDTRLAPDHEFQLVIDVLEASESFVTRHRSITPDALTRLLRARPSGPRPTLAQIRDALDQIQRWRDQILTRDLLQHRRQLVALRARTEAEQRRLSEDWVYLSRMLHETDALLCDALAPASERRALQ